MNPKTKKSRLTGCIIRKLSSDRGVSILFALLAFLVCFTVGSVVLTAGTTASGRLSKTAENDQRYYSASSAGSLIRGIVSEEPVTLILEKTTTKVTVEGKKYVKGSDTVEEYDDYDDDPDPDIAYKVYLQTDAGETEIGDFDFTSTDPRRAFLIRRAMDCVLGVNYVPGMLTTDEALFINPKFPVLERAVASETPSNWLDPSPYTITYRTEVVDNPTGGGTTGGGTTGGGTTGGGTAVSDTDDVFGGGGSGTGDLTFSGGGDSAAAAASAGAGSISAGGGTAVSGGGTGTTDLSALAITISCTEESDGSLSFRIDSNGYSTVAKYGIQMTETDATESGDPKTEVEEVETGLFKEITTETTTDRRTITVGWNFQGMENG